MDGLDYQTDNEEEELPKVINEAVSDMSEDSISPEELQKQDVIDLLGQDDSIKEEIPSTVINDAVTLIKKEDISITDVAMTDNSPELENRKNDNYCENMDIIINNMDNNDKIIYNLLQKLGKDLNKKGFLPLMNLNTFQCLLPDDIKLKDPYIQLDYLEKIIGNFHMTHYARIYDINISGISFGSIKIKNYHKLQEDIRKMFFDEDGILLDTLEESFGNVKVTVIDFLKKGIIKEVTNDVMKDDNIVQFPELTVEKRERGRPKKISDIKASPLKNVMVSPIKKIEDDHHY